MAKYRDTYQCYGLAIKADKMSPQKDYYLLLFKVNVLSNAYRVLTQSNKVAKIRNRYNQVPHLTQDTNGKVTNSQKTPQTRAKRSALSQQVTTKHI